MAERPLRVADFSTHLSGPMASHLLHEAGAEVIKIENPRVGDGNRGVTPLIHGQGNMHVSLSSGARSLAADLKSPHWDRLVAACASWADAVLVGGRLDDVRERRMDFSTFAAANDRIVYCLMTGYGMAGPWRNYTAHGQNPDAFAGRVDVEWHDGQPTTRPGWRSAGSTLAGVFAALGVLAALNRRDRGFERAQFVHTSLWGTAMWWNWRDITALANLGHGWNDYGDLGSRYAMYATADQRALVVCPIERKFWETFCDLVDLPREARERGDWSHGLDFGTEDERPLIAERLAKRTLDEWVEILAETAIPFAPVLTLEEALDSEHARANGVLRPTTVDGHEARIAASPVRVGDGEQAGVDPPSELSPPPAIGQHSQQIMAELGLLDVTPEDLVRRAD